MFIYVFHVLSYRLRGPESTNLPWTRKLMSRNECEAEISTSKDSFTVKIGKELLKLEWRNFI